MAAITSYTESERVKLPGMRVYQMSFTDGDTFTPENFEAEIAIPAYNADPATGNPIGCTISSGTITLECTGASAVAITLLVFGKD